MRNKPLQTYFSSFLFHSLFCISLYWFNRAAPFVCDPFLDFFTVKHFNQLFDFVTVFITKSFARRAAAAQFVYTFFASLLARILMPAVPNATPPAKRLAPLIVFLSISIFYLLLQRHILVFCFLSCESSARNLFAFITGIKRHRCAENHRPRPESVRLHLVTSLFFLPRICFFGAGFLGLDENNSRQIHKLSVYRYYSVLL